MAERARGDLEKFLLTLPLCQADVAHWFRVSRLRNSLAAKGLSISTPDTHVAQCALHLGGDLLSADAIFRLVARHTKLSLFRL
jgi:predicted nucleic acid-binding protein